MKRPQKKDYEVTNFENTGYYEKIPGPRDGKTGLYIEDLEKYIDMLEEQKRVYALNLTGNNTTYTG